MRVLVSYFTSWETNILCRPVWEIRVHIDSLSTNKCHPEAAQHVLKHTLFHPIDLACVQIADDVVGFWYVGLSPGLVIWNWKTGETLIVRVSLILSSHSSLKRLPFVDRPGRLLRRLLRLYLPLSPFLPPHQRLPLLLTRRLHLPLPSHSIPNPNQTRLPPPPRTRLLRLMREHSRPHWSLCRPPAERLFREHTVLHLPVRADPGRQPHLPQRDGHRDAVEPVCARTCALPACGGVCDYTWREGAGRRVGVVGSARDAGHASVFWVPVVEVRLFSTFQTKKS